MWIIITTRHQFGFFVGLNNGNGFEQYESWNPNNAGLNPRGYITCSNVSGIHADLKDMNGDGILDRIDYQNYRTGVFDFWVALNKSQKPILKSITRNKLKNVF
ncbi:MAG: hypothetical protein GY714_29285 [Desulfobacterales bacterium]|nr:hypothetical protein [Desulfobacterales bacterium]